METLLLITIIGSVTGLLGREVMKGGNPSQLFSIIVGVAGAFLGSRLFELYNIQVGDTLFTTITAAAVGAIALPMAFRLVRIA